MAKKDVLPEKKAVWLVSSCLVGLKTRYDGTCKPNESCLHFLEDKYWIPVCPEQLGGLPTPRPAASIRGGTGADVFLGMAQVVVKNGDDVSREFMRGAREILRLSTMLDIAGMCVKARSPSCGLHQILGVTSSLLLENGMFLKEF